MNKYVLEIGISGFTYEDVQFAKEQLNRTFLRLYKNSALRWEKISLDATHRRVTIQADGLRFEKEKGDPSKTSLDRSNLPIGDADTTNLLSVTTLDAPEKDQLADLLRLEMAKTLKKIKASLLHKHHDQKEDIAKGVRSSLSLWGDQIVDFEVDSIVASNEVLLKSEQGYFTLPCSDAGSYESLLEEHHVMIRETQRKKTITTHFNRYAKEKGAVVLMDDYVLEQIIFHNEYPVPFIGNMPEVPHDIPMDIITSPMKIHHQIFPIRSDKGYLLPYFVGVHEQQTSRVEDKIKDLEIQLEKLLKKTIECYREDLKYPLEHYADPMLDPIHPSVCGTRSERSQRIEKLVVMIAKQLEVGNETIQNVKRAAQLSKADLATRLVSEYPSMRGVIGEIYALQSGEPSIVAHAIREQYLPCGMNKPMPETTAGKILSVAIKLDDICTSFAAGLPANGSKDPFQLRRKSSRIIDILSQYNLNIRLDEMVEHSLFTVFDSGNSMFDYEVVKEEVLRFFIGRFKSRMAKEQIPREVVQSVLEVSSLNIAQIARKIEAVNEWILPETGMKSIRTLKRMESLTKDHVLTPVEVGLFRHESEKELYSQMAILDEIHTMIQQKAFLKALETIDELNHWVERFLDEVVVEVDDLELRNNRKSMLLQILREPQRIFDVKTITEARH